MLYTLFLWLISWFEGEEGAELRGGRMQSLLEYKYSAITSEVSRVNFRIHSTMGKSLPWLTRLSWSLHCYLKTVYSSLLTPPSSSQQPFSHLQREEIQDKEAAYFSLRIYVHMYVLISRILSFTSMSIDGMLQTRVFYIFPWLPLV